jgi:hypothetical protein
MTRSALARLGGLLYLGTLPTAGFGYGYVAFMPHEPAALAAALQAGRAVLPWSIALGAIGFIDYLVIGAIFHRLLAPTSKLAADLMLLFVAASVPLALAALAQRIDLVALLDAAPPQLAIETSRLVQHEHSLILLSTIFWGLWLLPLAWLSVRAGLIPRILGVLLAVAGLGYMSSFFLPLLAPGFDGTVAGKVVGPVLATATLVGEFALPWSHEDCGHRSIC